MKKNVKTIQDLKPIVLNEEQQQEVKAGGTGATSGIKIPTGL